MERIKGYSDILAREHGPAILTWLVQGCLEWQRQGLGEPAEVKAAVQDYREAQDVLLPFLQENCVKDAQSNVLTTELFRKYLNWCEANEDKYPLGKKTFNSRMTERGFVKRRGTENKNYWLGMRLRTADEIVTLVTNVTDFTLNYSREGDTKVFIGKNGNESNENNTVSKLEAENSQENSQPDSLNNSLILNNSLTILHGNVYI